MQTVKLTRISSTNKRKDGTPLEGKYGSYYRVGIQTEQHGEEWLNGFSNDNPSWEIGDEINIEVMEEEWNGKMQKKFRLAKDADVELHNKDKEIEELKKKLGEDTPVINVNGDDDDPF